MYAYKFSCQKIVPTYRTKNFPVTRVRVIQFISLISRGGLADAITTLTFAHAQKVNTGGHKPNCEIFVRSEYVERAHVKWVQKSLIPVKAVNIKNVRRS